MASGSDTMQGEAKSLYIVHSEPAPGEYIERLAALWSQHIEVRDAEDLDRLPAWSDRAPSGRTPRDDLAVMVLCGRNTWQDPRIDREIAFALAEGLPLIGVKLPSLRLFEGGCTKPRELQHAINEDRAAWVRWEELCQSTATLRACLALALRLRRSSGNALAGEPIDAAHPRPR